MRKKIIYFLPLFLLVNVLLYSQKGGRANYNSFSSGNSSSLNPFKLFPVASDSSTSKFAFHPSVGLSVGMFSFFGDMYDKHFQSPTVGRISYQLSIGQQLTDYLNLDIYGLYGKLGADERFAADHRNLNFQSTITSGGINVTYNFGNFLPKDRIISPYLSLGAEAFQFISKTDLVDKYGNTYYYWSDGSIRNLPQTDANALSATFITRDYNYETDIRSLNADGFGNYSQVAFGFPVGAGFSIRFNDNLSLKMGTAMHFTTTDYIDGITAASVGNRAGNSRNDKFMYSSLTLTYTFWNHHNEMKDEDMVALDKLDSDGDGVPDTKDDCPCTPKNIPVDGSGCPFDDDKDGVANYRDDEPGTPQNSFVNERGVRLSDSLLEYRMGLYLDSTGAYTQHETHDHNEATAYKSFYDKEYMVSLGTFVKSVPSSTMVKLLDIKDVQSNVFSKNITMYTSGNFKNINDAEQRRQELIAYGMPYTKIVYRQQGEFFDPAVKRKPRVQNPEAVANSGNTSQPVAGNPPPANAENPAPANNANPAAATNPAPGAKTVKLEDNAAVKKYASTTTMSPEAKAGADKINIAITDPNSPLNTPDIVLTVQLGAFAEKLPQEAFDDIKDLIEAETDDGLFKYTVGIFKEFAPADERKNLMITKGFEGAFVTAYQQGRRIPLSAAGAPPYDPSKAPPATVAKPLNENLGILFRVQVAKFKAEVSVKRFNELSKIEGLIPMDDQEGNTRYLAGSFKDYDQAKEFEKQLKEKYNLRDAFLVAEKFGTFMTVKEAMKLMKQ